MAAFLNIRRIDVASLELATACARTGSLSAAARALCMSVPTASQRLSALEDAVGRPLFVRSTSGLTITSAGCVVAEHGHQMLQAMARMREEVAWTMASALSEANHPRM